MVNSAYPDQLASRNQLIWIYTVCKDMVYPGSAGQGLIARLYKQLKKKTKLWFILQKITGRKCATLSGTVPTSFWHFADVSLRHFTDVRLCNVVFNRANNVRNACKHLSYSQNCWRDFFKQWRTVGRLWRIQLLFRRFLYVQIKIDQLLCVVFWVIVCVKVLRPSQPNWVMSSAVSLPNHTFTGQA